MLSDLIAEMATRRDKARQSDLGARRVKPIPNSLASFTALELLARLVTHGPHHPPAPLTSQQGEAMHGEARRGEFNSL